MPRFIRKTHGPCFVGSRFENVGILQFSTIEGAIRHSTKSFIRQLAEPGDFVRLYLRSQPDAENTVIARVIFRGTYRDGSPIADVFYEHGFEEITADLSKPQAKTLDLNEEEIRALLSVSGGIPEHLNIDPTRRASSMHNDLVNARNKLVNYLKENK